MTGITPACAGNTLSATCFTTNLRDHPRLRGEYYNSPFKILIAVGSPPLARGILYVVGLNVTLEGITPACAGNTGWKRTHRTHYQDHPRLRGEYYLSDYLRLQKQGSPPLARGIL